VAKNKSKSKRQKTKGTQSKGGLLKKSKRSKKGALPKYDRYALYRAAVQAPDVDCEFLAHAYKEIRGGKARVLREDFCGTFAICCEWVKMHKENQAIGVDLDPEPLAYGKANYLSELKPAQQKRVLLQNGSVLTARVPAADIVIAMNFSFYLFKSRLMLRQYFSRALKGLKSKGLFVVDCFGGPACHGELEEKTKFKDFYYYWDQKNFNPITHEAKFQIHFKRKGEKKRKKQFEYDWRMWTIPEIRELMLEAGFSKTEVYWEGATRSGDGNGVFTRSEVGEECEAFIAYIVGQP
jgi:hypothetical protein